MKTPQEQAEEIDVKIDLCGGKYTYIRYKNGGQKALRYGEEWRDLTGDNLVYWLAVELLQTRSTPLPELIAVARAAASDKKDEECTCGTDPERSCRYCGYFIRLDRALQALRATGKVEL
jgi:hypothetical protein